jgi:hypothetical protein
MFGKDSSTTPSPIRADEGTDALIARMQGGLRDGPGKDFVEDLCWLRLYKLIFALANGGIVLEDFLFLKAEAKHLLFTLQELGRRNKEAEWAAAKMKSIYKSADNLGASRSTVPQS